MTLAPMTDNNGARWWATSPPADDITERAGAQIALETALATERRRSRTSPRSTAPRTRSSPASATSCAHRSRTSSATSSSCSTGRTATTTATQHEALGRIDTNSHRLLELIDDLLTLSQHRVARRRSWQAAGRPARGRPPGRPARCRRRLVAARAAARRWSCPRSRSSSSATGAPRADGLQPGHQRGQVHPRRRPHHVAGARRRARRTPSRCRTPASASRRGAVAAVQPVLPRRRYAQTEAIQGSGLGLSIARASPSARSADQRDLDASDGARRSP